MGMKVSREMEAKLLSMGVITSVTCLPGQPIQEAKPSKYRSEWTEVDGIKFQSKKEAERWGYLKLFQQQGIIKDLQRQVPFSIDINGIHICNYIADFVYINANGDRVIEDVKDEATRKIDRYKIKKNLMKAVLGIEIQEHL